MCFVREHMHISTSVVADFSKFFLDFSGFGFVTCYILGVGTKRWPFKNGRQIPKKNNIFGMEAMASKF